MRMNKRIQSCAAESHSFLKQLDRAFVWGVFDVFHEGHESFLRWARKQTRFLYVVVLPDEIVRKAKGRYPIQSAEERLLNIVNLGFVDSAMVDCVEWGLHSLAAVKPTAVLLGKEQPEKWVVITERLLGITLETRRCPSKGPRHTTDIIERYGAGQLRRLGSVGVLADFESRLKARVRED